MSDCETPLDISAVTNYISPHNHSHELFVLSSLYNKKQTKTSHPSTEAIAEVLVVHKNKQVEKKEARVLLDTGSSGSIILNDFTGTLAPSSAMTTQWTTKGGIFTTQGTSDIRFRLIEFSTQDTINWTFHVDGTKARQQTSYDMIIGRDLLEELGIDISFRNNTITWEEATIPMKEYGTVQNMDFIRESVNEVYNTLSINQIAKRTIKITDAKYEKADLPSVVMEATHLTKEQQAGLLPLLQKYEGLFDGTLGEWQGKEVFLKLKPNVQPYHTRPSPVPQIHEQTLRKEVKRLVELGVLERCSESEWAAASFIIPKKNGQVRIVTDFRKLNECLRRMPYPIPKITELLQKLQGFQFVTSLDLNMGYYTIRLSPEAQDLCTIVFPFGKYKYKRLPMGVKTAPDVFQSCMAELFMDLEAVRVYLDDLLVVSKGTFEELLQDIEQVLIRLQKAGLKVNITKSFFAKHETEYLGYWVTRQGVKPMPNKVEAMMKIEAPKTKKQLRGFIGLVNYYRDMWKGRSHLLAPLTALTSKTVKWQWTDKEQKAFNEIKKVISRDVLLSYPDFSKPFVIYTDASKVQLGAVITQDGKPIAFYSRKLNSAQRNYTTTERELLSIVETLKEFKTILLGFEITIFTDHQNLIHDDLKSERVLRWRLIVEEYGPEIKYIKGEKNIPADLLSRLDTANTMTDKYVPNEMEIAECFGIDKDVSQQLPINTKLIHKLQWQDKKLLKLVQTKDDFTIQSFRGSDVICHRGKIVVPKALQQRTIDWYHQMLCHPGETRTEQTIKQHMTWPNMRQMVHKTVQTCPICQKNKKQRKKYGHLPAKQAEFQPWDHLCVDMVGPYKIRRSGKPDLQLQAVTMIDPATGWFEIVQ